MDLNGKAGSWLAKILIALTIIFSLYFAMRKPAYYHAFAYYQLDPSICYPTNGIAIGDRITTSKAQLNKLFENNEYKIGDSAFPEYEGDWAATAEGRFVTGGLSFDRMHAAAIGGVLRQVSYDQCFRGIKSVYESNKFFKALRYAYEKSYGNGMNTYQAWSEKGEPTEHSFDILIERERYGFGFYCVRVIFSQPGYETTDLYSGKTYD